jgi:hypothetical protein
MSLEVSKQALVNATTRELNEFKIWLSEQYTVQGQARPKKGQGRFRLRYWG